MRGKWGAWFVPVRLLCVSLAAVMLVSGLAIGSA